MTKEDIIQMAYEAGLVGKPSENSTEFLEAFAAIVVSAERKKIKGEIATLHAMYELASKQRDYLMDQQRAEVAAIRGMMQ